MFLVEASDVMYACTTLGSQLQSDWSLSCDHGGLDYASWCENNNNNNNKLSGEHTIKKAEPQSQDGEHKRKIRRSVVIYVRIEKMMY